MQQPEPQREHQWLQRMVGRWTSEHEAKMGPDEPTMNLTGSEVVRSLGGLWVVAEGQGEMPDGGAARTVMSLGYDPQKEKFVGTFIGSMMTNLWIYEGTLDDARDKLTLDTEGPDFSGGPNLARYRDSLAFISDDHRVLTSEVLDEDGQWQQFVTVHYRREE